MDEILAEIVLQVACYGMGRLLLPLLSLGYLRGERWKDEAIPPGSKYYWRDENRLVLGNGLTIFVGAVFWILLGIVAYRFFIR